MAITDILVSFVIVVIFVIVGSCARINSTPGRCGKSENKMYPVANLGVYSVSPIR